MSQDQQPSNSRTCSLPKLSPKLVRYTHELVALRAKRKDIASFLGVPLAYVKEVFDLQPNEALRRPPNGMTRSIASGGVSAATKQVYAAMAADFDRLVRGGMEGVDAGMAALHRAVNAHRLFGIGAPLRASPWLALCRNLQCGIAVLRRCRACNSAIVFEDAREERYARLKCPWCRHDSGFLDFTATERRRESRR